MYWTSRRSVHALHAWVFNDTIVYMKKAVHPKYFEATVQCACGNAFSVGSTKEKLEIEICSSCHPFYTGGSKIIDTAGRVEKFKARLAKKKPARP